MAQVNVFLLGAQKAGTTSVYDWIGQHPDVDAPQEIKDHHFFSDDRIYPKGHKYLERFYKSSCAIRVHGAVNYLYFAERASERIYRYNSDSRLVICLREPRARAISAYKYFVRTQRESRSFEEALGMELRGGLTSYEELANNTYIEHGLYQEQIVAYLKYFERPKIHFMFFEDLADSSRQQETMRALCRFLGVDENVDFAFSHRNASMMPKSKAINYIIRRSGFGRLVKFVLPFGLRKRLGKRIEQWNLSDEPILADISASSVAILEGCFVGHAEKLSSLLDIPVGEKWY